MAAANSQRDSRTMLWCVPRSGSTSLTKCLSAVNDIEIWFEPFSFCNVAKVEYQGRLKQQLPTEFVGNEEAFRKAADLLSEASHCRYDPEHFAYSAIRRKLECSPSRHVFVKDMAYALPTDHFKYIPAGFKHTFLIRHPLRVHNSQRNAVMAQFSARYQPVIAADEFDCERDDPWMTSGFFFKEVYDIWLFVRANIDPNPIVIDGDDLLSRPAEVLPKYCREIGIPYDESLLKWDSSAEVTKSWKTPSAHIEQQGLLTAYSAFFQRALNSGEFHPPSKMPTQDEVCPDVIRCSEVVMKYYSEMYENRLKV